MKIDENSKRIQKGYCQTVLAENGRLTKELNDKIEAGDINVMRQVYVDQQERIRQIAAKIDNPTDKEITLSRVNSIQEVLDNLTEILNA
jgi:hypothetical protein